ncbi:MAG: mechanosensitive ion channel [Acidobacteria bacterium]|nr:mechanosensitive ion channel [Acidobacteriota bacterium]MCI0720390.1 mechanosensitive ion channel [Acidobacteriota bacterium]
MANSFPLWMLLLIGLLAIGSQVLLVRVRRRIHSRIAKDQPFAGIVRGLLAWGFGLASAGLWALTIIGFLELVPQTEAVAHRLLSWAVAVVRWLRDVVFTPFVTMGNSRISVFTVFQVIVFVAVIVLLARTSRQVLLKQILSKTPLDLGIQHAVATFTQYMVLAFGFLVGLPTVGVNLSALSFLAGAVGVGVGFGLQNITNNFISGIIILFERPIKIGDRIEVGDVNGDVVHIAARSTTVRTNDNIAIIIPNSSFISSNVINWSHGDSKVRFRVPVQVAYDSDVRLVERLLLEVARDNENVLEDPPPRVIFKEFGDSALKFELRVWSSRLLHRRGVLISQLNFAIFEKFKEQSIQIPYPQRDLHLKLDGRTINFQAAALPPSETVSSSENTPKG